MNIEIANRLFQYRKKHNLSQEELASKIGVSRQAVSKWERAEASPDTDNLILLAKLYGVTLDELLQGKEEPQVQPEKDNENHADASENDRNDTDENEKSEETDNQNYTKCDSVSFKNGIHIHSKDGDDVDISLKDGVNVNDKNGTKVKVGLDGIHVEENGEKKVYTDENGQVFYSDEVSKKSHKKKNPWMIFPYPIVALIMFFVWGTLNVWGGYAVSWIVFLTIPLYYTTVEAIIKKNPKIFCYPVLVVVVYLFLGLYFGLWHPLWILFITIPIYYCICDLFKKDKSEK